MQKILIKCFSCRFRTGDFCCLTSCDLKRPRISISNNLSIVTSESLVSLPCQNFVNKISKNKWREYTVRNIKNNKDADDSNIFSQKFIEK